MSPDEGYRGPRLFRRLLFGALLIVVSCASASAVAGFNELDRVAEVFEDGPALGLDRDLAEADAGKPQTIMIIGSDKRAKSARDVQTGVAGGARSDTVILVRLDPSKEAIALLSLPRDLKVRIPGHGTDKLNAAFSIGGPRLTLRTVKQLTGLSVNHVINVDFGGFREAVNRIGCVYVDIDRRYFNDNSGGGERYATIDVKQGYQRLCGSSALDYVRYRHEDNDIVRAARQQEFLRQMKVQVGLGELVEDRDELLNIFGRYTRSDIRGKRQVLSLLKLALASAKHPVREVHFRGRIGASYVTASDSVVKRLADDFLGVKATKGPRGELRPRRGKRKGERVTEAGLEDTTAAGKDQALKAIGLGARIPLFYPRKRTRRALFAGDPRVYGIRDPDGKVHNSYRMVIKRGLVGEYYGIQGTTWLEPPILATPSEKRKIGGREYELHYDGDRLRLVAWRTAHGVYWLSNTLLLSLTERQMLEIAKSAKLLG